MSTQSKEATVIQSGQGRKMNVLGHAVTLKLTEQETQGTYYVFELVTPPGHGIPPHVHKNEDEVIQVVEGEYEIQLGEQTYQAKAGAVIHFPRSIAHAFRNAGSKPGTTVWTVIPGANFEKFFEELGALPAGGPPDMARVAAIFSKYEIELLPLPVQ
ncbi:MAG: cupin domain-containing protein [Anaerolineae bacterium]|nr:cupin domain-containing protein [Anaerolineales bacterium]MCQ3980333.1 cupin domain-containing protein [Anaerolineae bacterium]